MSWTIVPEDENNEAIVTLTNEFATKITEYANQLKLLCYLDPYGDTVFNAVQMDDVIGDLRFLKLSSGDVVIDQIIELAERCKKEIHEYLVFYGD